MALVVVDKCWSCGKAKAKSICSVCKTAAYCNGDCQKTGWALHKKECKEIVEKDLSETLIKDCIMGNVQKVHAALFTATGKVKANVNYTYTPPGKDAGLGLLFPLYCSLSITDEKYGPNHLRIIELLLSAGANPNLVGGTNAQSPLFLSCLHNRIDAVRVLLKGGADINLANANGDTPLSICCEFSHTEIYFFLLTKYANPNLAQTDGTTPIMTAASHGNEEVIRTLVTHGGNVNLVTKTGLTAIGMAAKEGQPNVLRVLVTLGGDINQPDETGATPVFLAAEMGHARTVQALFSCGALPSANTPNNKGETPLDVATRCGLEQVEAVKRARYEEVERILIDYGAKAGTLDSEEGVR